MVSLWRVALPLLTVAATVVSPVAASGEGYALAARVSGQYRVAYHALAGAHPLGTRVWGVVPVCKHGACAIDISSRARGAKTDGTLRFKLRSGSYVRKELDPEFSDCVDSSGHVLAFKVYTREISQSFHATRRSRLGRALAFAGTAVYTYRASGAAVGRGCKASVQRFTFTGTAVGSGGAA